MRSGSGGVAGEDGKVIIRIADLTKRYGAVPALRSVSLDIREGEFFCLLGPSGCGKSTLLRVLAGFEAAEEGRIELDGADIAGVPAHRRPVNMMFQSYALFPHLTVANNILYGLKLARLRATERGARLAEMIGLTRLEGLENRYPGQLSGGQRQRVALARALARRPRVLLLDEPLAALDRALRQRTQAELKALQARLGTTFVTVTHDQDEAMALADRIGILQDGCVAQVGTPREIYDRPASRFVAGFLGVANLLEGVLEGRAGAVCQLRLPTGELVTGESDLDLVPGEPAAATVRPERIIVSTAPSCAPEGLEGRLTQTVFLGDRTEIRVELRSGLTLTASVPSRDGPDMALGDLVTVTLVPAATRIVR